LCIRDRLYGAVAALANGVAIGRARRIARLLLAGFGLA
jgi:hypothetical protein